jgi:hypothetical protein
MRSKSHSAIRRDCEYGFVMLSDDGHARELSLGATNVLFSGPTIFGAFAILPAILAASPHHSPGEILASIQRLTKNPRLREIIETFKGGMAITLEGDRLPKKALIVKAVTFDVTLPESQELHVTALPLGKNKRELLRIGTKEHGAHDTQDFKPHIATPILLRVTCTESSEENRNCDPRVHVNGNSHFPISISGYFKCGSNGGRAHYATSQTGADGAEPKG